MSTDNSTRACEIVPAVAADILHLRDMYRQEMNCQIRHDAHHERGFTALYLVLIDGKPAGYGTVGDYDSQKTEVITEFYLTPPHRRSALPVFRALIEAGRATQVEAQTNDRLLLLMLYDVCVPESIKTEVILFEDAGATCLQAPDGIMFRRNPVKGNSGFQIDRDDVIAEADGETVGTAGFLTHYNPPYGDAWMDVNEGYRRRGIGSYLVQEAKRACYEAGRRPSARCGASNTASRRTLQRAGFLPCARLLRGGIAAPA